MSKSIIHYTVIREYGNLYGLEEFVRRIIQRHFEDVQIDNVLKGCSNQEVKNYEQTIG